MNSLIVPSNKVINSVIINLTIKVKFYYFVHFEEE